MKTKLYHGTTMKIDCFENDNIGKGEDPNSHLGIFLTSDYEVAKSFAEVRSILKGGSPTIIECEVDIKNPFYMEEREEYYGSEDEGTKCKEYFKELRKDLIEEEYDVVVDNFSEDSMYVVLNAKDIKILNNIEV